MDGAILDVHYPDREEEGEKKEYAGRVGVPAGAADDVEHEHVVLNEAGAEDECAHSTPDVGRATFVPPHGRRLVDRGRATAGGSLQLGPCSFTVLWAR